mgnify:CR=1 FL=1
MDLLDLLLLEDDDEEEAVVASSVHAAVSAAAMANTIWMVGAITSSEEVATKKMKNTNWRLPPRKKKTKWRHSEALQCIKRDYFGCDSIPDSHLFRGGGGGLL